MLVGWIKIHRKILDHWVAQDPELLAVWIRLLSEANHSTTKKMFNGALTTIDRGQMVFGLEAFSAKSGVSIAKLRRYLKLLETDGMINRQKTNKYSIITIACYEQYQSDDRQSASKEQADDKQTTSKQQHRKNVKNEEECKEEHIGDKSPQNKYTEGDLKCAEYIFGGVLGLNPEAKKPNMDKWANTVRLIRERDGRTHREIAELFKWANNDPFWKTNILSPDKLRAQWDKLTIKKTHQESGNEAYRNSSRPKSGAQILAEGCKGAFDAD